MSLVSEYSPQHFDLKPFSVSESRKVMQL